MWGFLKRVFGKKEPEPQPQFSDEEYDRSYEAKEAALEAILGPMHNMVGHAMIPFCVGGAVDMYYFPNGLPGTGFATMELIEPDGSGPKPNRIGTYELVTFTRLRMPAQRDRQDAGDPFNKIERRMCNLMTMMGRYAHMAVLNPGDTCEIPVIDDEPSRFVLFDEYNPNGKPFVVAGRRHCLLLCLEVFRSEMDHARAHGSAVVLEKLKAAGHYPYSDLDRDPVY